MELDDFKKIKMNHQADKAGREEDPYASLIDRIRKNLTKQKKKARYFAFIDILIAVIYAVTLRRDELCNNIGLTLACTGLALGAIYLYSKSRMIRNSLYSLPLVNFLEEVEKRLIFMRLYDWLVVIPLLLMLGTGGGFIVVSRLSRYTQNIGMITTIWVIFFIALVVFAFTVSGKDWQKQQGELLDSVREIKKSLAETKD
jgi:H+/gluconate symporter-like permease